MNRPDWHYHLREHRGQHVGLLAPLVVNRKGVYTDLAKWAKARGNTHLRVDGEFVPVAPWPKLDRFREHTIELPVGDLMIEPENEAQLRSLLDATVTQFRMMRARADTVEAYDQMIGEGNSEGNAVVQAGIDALIAQTRGIERVVSLLGLDTRVTIESSDSLTNPEAVFQ